MELTKSANPSRTEASSSTIEIIDASGIRFLYVQTTLDPKKLLALLRAGGFGYRPRSYELHQRE
jgi:hypothetical protein